MSRWFTIGMPILVAILLVVSAVSITVALMKDNTTKQVTAQAYTPTKTADNQIAQAGPGPNYPGYNQGVNNVPAVVPAPITGNASGNTSGVPSCHLNADDQGTSATTGSYSGGCGAGNGGGCGMMRR